MARLIVDGPNLVVGLSWLEKLGALRGNVRVPLRFEAAVMTGRVSYNHAGQVAGLFFLNEP